MEANVPDIDTINLYFALLNVNEPEQGLQDRGLAGPCSADNADFHSWIDFERELLDARVEEIAVAHGDIFKFNTPLIRPLLLTSSWHQCHISRLAQLILTVDLGEFNYPLRRREVIFHLCSLPHEVRVPDDDVRDRLEGEGEGLGGVHTLLRDRENNNREGKQDAHLVQPNTHPPVHSIKAEGNICALLDVINKLLTEKLLSLVASDGDEAVDDHGKLGVYGASVNSIHPYTFPLWNHRLAHNKNHYRY